MRDFDKERELLEKVGPVEQDVPPTRPRSQPSGGTSAATESLSRHKAHKFREAGLVAARNNGEALSHDRSGGRPTAAEGEPKPRRAKPSSRLVGGDQASAATGPADDAVAELLRLGQEAAAHADKLTKRVDPVEGRPDRPWRRNKLQLARNAAADMVERLLAFLNHVAGDPDHESSVGPDEREHDLDSEEGDDLEIYGESDLSSTECIDQRHIGQGNHYGQDAEMNLASTNGIDQRWTHTGSRTGREVDGFPYDEPERKGFTEPTSSARAETEADLHKRGLRKRHEGNIVELILWRR